MVSSKIIQRVSAVVVSPLRNYHCITEANYHAGGTLTTCGLPLDLTFFSKGICHGVWIDVQICLSARQKRINDVKVNGTTSPFSSIIAPLSSVSGFEIVHVAGFGGSIIARHLIM